MEGAKHTFEKEWLEKGFGGPLSDKLSDEYATGNATYRVFNLCECMG